MKLELECKIPIDDRAALASRLHALGAEDCGEVYERNWVLDTPDRSLHASYTLLRLRVEDGAEHALLTIKKPARQSEFKSRQEYEVTVESKSAMLMALQALGYDVVWYYEKKRARWRYNGCTIALDDLPQIGSFIEIEAGTESRISEALQQLDINPNDHVDGTYRSLYEQYCEKYGHSVGDMEFHQGNSQSSQQNMQKSGSS